MPKNRASSVDRLPEEVRAEIVRLRDSGRTYQEIVEHLKSFNVEISHSALGRWTKKKERIAESIRKSRDMAEAVSRSFGDKEVSKVARTNVELLHTLLLKLMVGEDEEDVRLDAKEAMFLATALEKAAKASKTDLDGQIKAAVEEERRATLEKSAAAVETTARRHGLTAETVNAIKASVLGVSP